MAEQQDQSNSSDRLENSDNYILMTRLGKEPKFTDIDRICTNMFQYTKSYNENIFKKLEECGFELLNKEDYPDWVGLPIHNTSNQVILFRDIEFYNAFKCKDGSILVRWYKIEKLGHIRMKQVIYTKPKHLKKPLYELVTVASMKQYNITLPTNNYARDNIVIPYNIRGMLTTGELGSLQHNYEAKQFDYLDGELPNHMRLKRLLLRKTFIEMTDESCFNFTLCNDYTRWELKPFKGDNFGPEYIRGSTYFD